jgi:hypothetical protein
LKKEFLFFLKGFLVLWLLMGESNKVAERVADTLLALLETNLAIISGSCSLQMPPFSPFLPGPR